MHKIIHENIQRAKLLKSRIYQGIQYGKAVSRKTDRRIFSPKGTFSLSILKFSAINQIYGILDSEKSTRDFLLSYKPVFEIMT